MRICFTLPRLPIGGLERAITPLMRGLLQRGHQVDLFLQNMRIHRLIWMPQAVRLFVANDNPDAKTVAVPGYNELRNRVTFIKPPKYVWRDRIKIALRLSGHLPGAGRVKNVRPIADYIRAQKPDIVFSGNYSNSFDALLANQLLEHPVPIVPVIHAHLIPSRNPRRRAECYRRLMREAVRVVGVSGGVCDSVSDTLGVARQKITAIYNPVVTPELESMRMQSPNHPWFADGGAPIILGAGTFTDAEKNFALLINAFARIVKRRDCRLVIIGDGENREAFEAQIAQLGLRDKVSLPGWSDNPFAFMARASLFAMSSNSEGFGLALAEALACGCPCVSTDCPSGPAEILRGGEFGELVPVGDANALADAMLRTLDNPPDKQKLMNRAADFSVDIAVDKYENLIREVVQCAKPNFVHSHLI